MYHFCTYFDKNYAPKGLLLFDSLKRLNISFHLYVLCLDEATFQLLERLDEKITPVRLSSLEKNVGKLKRAKSNRSLIEYYFTLTSVWCHYLITTKEQIKILSYLDSDLYFYNNPSLIFEELGNKSVLIIPHNFSKKNDHLNVYGRYNVGFICWKKNEAGLKCLSDWKSDCLKWCYDKLEGNKFADQKYLDRWPENSEYEVISSKNPGLNAAYYNIGYQEVTEKKGTIMINESPLVFYHFHKIKKLGKNHFSINLLDSEGYKNRIIIEKIYADYIRLLRRKEKEINIQSDSIRPSAFEPSMSLREKLNHLIFDYNLIVNSIFVLNLRLEDQLQFLLRPYRTLKGTLKNKNRTWKKFF